MSTHSGQSGYHWNAAVSALAERGRRTARLSPGEGSTITTDQHGAYGALFAFAEHKTTDHSKHYVNEDGAHTNNAESLFGRIRQAHSGAWHRMTVEWRAFYAAEMAWRQEMVGRGNLEQLRDLLSVSLSPYRAQVPGALIS